MKKCRVSLFFLKICDECLDMRKFVFILAVIHEWIRLSFKISAKI
jgi:hypothetical protein